MRARPDLFVQVEDVERRAARQGRNKLAVAFDLEGGVPLVGRPEMVQLFYDLGVRQIHLAYNRNNSDRRRLLRRRRAAHRVRPARGRAINEAGMLMDCSHTGHRTSLDIMAASEAPVIFSHANPRALCDDGRNIRDEQIDACVATGGVVCVNGVGRFLGDPRAGTAAILRHLDHLVEMVGPDHVGLGLDCTTIKGWTSTRTASIAPSGGPATAAGRWGWIAAPEQFPEITVAARPRLRRGRCA